MCRGLLMSGSRLSEESDVSYPSDVAVTPNGQIVVVDTFNHRMLRITPEIE